MFITKTIDAPFKVKPCTETGQIGVIGVLVNVITVQEQEHGTELDLVQTQNLLATEGSVVHSFPYRGYFVITNI